MCAHLSEESPYKIADFSDSILYLNSDQYFQGYCMLEYKWHVKELFELSEKERAELMTHVCRAAKALQALFSPHKMNYELLGNQVPHIHWHLIPRFNTDPAWPNPVWTLPHSPVTLSSQEVQEQIKRLRKCL